MTSQAEAAAAITPIKTESGWIVAMPDGIAQMFGLPVDLPVTFQVEPGRINAKLELAEQTSEARMREPGWFIRMPSEMALAADVAEGSIIGLYTKLGVPYVEIYPPPSPDLKASINGILGKYKDAFEEMKRRGD
ncbi:MAG: hypothetical protein ACREEM_55830 [Blastocatellia bacterium]